MRVTRTFDHMTRTAELIDAVKKGDATAVRGLLEADPSLLHARGDNGASAILLAVYHRHPELTEIFAELGARFDVFEASATGRLERVDELTRDNPGLVDAVAADGFFPLGLAAFFGHRAVVELLLVRGADVNTRAANPMQVAAIHAAVARRDAQIVRLLVERGADVNARQQAGFTPLHEAARHGGEDIVDLLLAHGADSAARSEEGKAAADYARDRGHAALAARLDALAPPS